MYPTRAVTAASENAWGARPSRAALRTQLPASLYLNSGGISKEILRFSSCFFKVTNNTLLVSLATLCGTLPVCSGGVSVAE